MTVLLASGRQFKPAPADVAARPPGAIYLDKPDLQWRLAAFTDARFVEIGGAGHMVHFDRPHDLVTTIRDFLLGAAAV